MLRGMAKQGKAARALARARNLREKGKHTVGELASIGGSWAGGGWTGDRMAKDEQKDPTGKSGVLTVAGRALPKYETLAGGGLLALTLLGVKMGPELGGAVRGLGKGVLAGSHAVRRYKFRLTNPLANGA